MVVIVINSIVAAIGLWTVLLLWLLFTFIYKAFENQPLNSNQMKIKATQGDCIAIPEDCTVNIQDGCVVFEPARREFKDGDILAVRSNDGNITPFIYAGDDEEGYHKFYVGIDAGGGLQQSSGGTRWGRCPLQPATQSEAQALFEKMKQRGLRWNAEEKRVETRRYRAEKGALYWYISGLSEIEKTTEEDIDIDDEYYASGNYFRSLVEAARFLDIIKDALRKFHQDDQL